MLFNSLEFAIFLPVVFLLYWFVFSETTLWRNLFLLLVSYIFYGWWDYRFLGLIIFSSAVDYWIGKTIYQSEDIKTRKLLLAGSLMVNLGLLGVFKYYNFFVESFVSAVNKLGVSFQFDLIHIILPVGISFYTFQTLSYTIDIYKKKLEPARDVVAFFSFVAFFPQLVAGPIERATNLLGQFYEVKKVDSQEIKEGLRQILWGLFTKVAIADQCAYFVNDIFSNYDQYSAPVLTLGAVLFAFQIYGDFSGYSNIAIGTARLFGFKLMQNFAYPYFSRDFGEFWRRWHISLSTWFRDYLYIPLGGSKGGQWLQFRNVMIIFIVSGFWHGANWTFIIWGALNAIFFLPLLFLKKNRQHMDIVAVDRRLPSLKDFFLILTTFAFTCLAWIFFRSESVIDALAYLQQMTDFSFKFFGASMLYKLVFVLINVFILIVMEWRSRRKAFPFENDTGNTSLRWAYYLACGVLILMNGESEETFIYFQF